MKSSLSSPNFSWRVCRTAACSQPGSAPAALSALQLVVVGGYYTDHDVRERLAYPGQLAKTISVWRIPDYVHEGLIDAVQEHGPVWRDPATGVRATPERQSESTDEGGRDGRDSA